MAIPDAREWALKGHADPLVARSWADGRDPTHVVLLAHGYAEHSGRYHHVAAALVANGAVVHAVDHVGHGKSGGERALVTDFHLLVDDLRELDVRAREQHPDRPVVVVGHSMGGLVAALYAQRYGDSIAGVVLSAPLVGAYEAGPRLLALPSLPDLRVDPEVLTRDEEMRRRYAEDPLVWHGSMKRETLDAIVRGLAALKAGPSLQGLPMLWLHGDADVAMPASDSRNGIEHLCGDVLVERIYPGARHEVFNDVNRGEVLATLTDFINGMVLAREYRQNEH